MNGPANRIVEVAQPEERQAAWRLLWRRYHSEALFDVDPPPELLEESTGGLFVARRRGRVVGAVGVQRGVAQLATVYPPACAEGEPPSTTRHLLEALEHQLRDQSIRLARSLLPLSDQDAELQLRTIGFETVTTIVSMMWGLAGSPGRSPRPRLLLVPVGTDNWNELVAVTQRTYDGTLDCPRLAEYVQAGDVLRAYRQAPNYDSRAWYLAEREGQVVGCLILGNDEDEEQGEITYLGLIPAQRGHRLGAELIAEAQAWARRQRHRRITVAVDISNEPAVESYQRAGFVPYQRQRLMAWFNA